MFDWDRDFDAALAHPEPAAAAQTPSSGKPGTIRAFLMLWVAPLVVVGGLGLSGAFQAGPDGSPAIAASLGSLTRVLFGAPPLEMPSDLLVYGEVQFANFTRGIAGFDDAALVSFAEETMQGLDRQDDLLLPFALDMLLLTHAEIERRGLQRPAADAALQDLRADYRTRLAAL